MSDCMCGVVGVDLDYHHEHCAVWLKAELDAEKLRQKMLQTCYEHGKRELESQLQAANSRLERAEKHLIEHDNGYKRCRVCLSQWDMHDRPWHGEKCHFALVSPTPASDSPKERQ